MLKRAVELALELGEHRPPSSRTIPTETNWPMREVVPKRLSVVALFRARAAPIKKTVRARQFSARDSSP